MRTPLYVAIAIGSIVFGVLGAFTIGVPFLLTGVAMLVVFPWRTRRDVVWPAVAAPWAFTVTYVLLAPLSCTTSASNGSLSHTECTNVLGIGYGGGGAYDPPLLPAFLAGLVASGLTVFVLRRLLAKRTVDA